MRKLLFFSCLLLIISQNISAQTADKTNLSLQVASAAAENRAQLTNYVWTRTVQIFTEGELKVTNVSSMSVGSNGKIVTTAVSSTPAKPLPGGIGEILREVK